MIIWGWKTKQIGEKPLDLICHTCGNDSIFIIGLQRVFDLYWIPTIPLKKENVIHCKACGTQFPCELYSDYLGANEKSFNTPWWCYSGLLIVAALVSITMIKQVFNLN